MNGTFTQNPFSAGLGGLIKTYMMADRLREQDRDRARTQQFREQLLGLREKQFGLSAESLGISRRREARLSQPSATEQINELMLGQLQNLPPERIAEFAKRKYGGGPRTTFQVDKFTELIDAEFDDYQMGEPGGTIQATDAWGEPETILSDSFAPDSKRLDSMINEIGSTYSDITGMSEESIKNLARMRAKNKWPSYQPPSLFKAAPSGGEPSEMDSAISQARANLGEGATDNQLISEARRILESEKPVGFLRQKSSEWLTPETGRVPEVPGEEIPPPTTAGQEWTPDDTRYYIEPPPLRDKIPVWMQLPEKIRRGLWEMHERGEGVQFDYTKEGDKITSMTVTNPTTGKRIVSLDGGATWRELP